MIITCKVPSLEAVDGLAFVSHGILVLGELKGDKDMLVLTANTGIGMVVMDRQDYINKSSNLLAQPEYRPIPRDPTNKIKAKLSTILKKG